MILCVLDYSKISYGFFQILPSLYGRGLRGGLPKSSLYNLNNTLRIVQYVVVPEAQDFITLPCKPFISFNIFNRTCVLPAVQFDNHLLFETYKINDIFADWLLSSDLKEPSICLNLKYLHNNFSASVQFFLRFFARVDILFLITHPHPTLPHRGGGKNLFHFIKFIHQS